MKLFGHLSPPFFAAVLCLVASAFASANDRVKVFLLCGQSNMEGKAKVTLLQHQIKAEGTKARFAHLHKDGVFHKRDDVFIKFLGRKGPLTVGYGSPGRIGPELEFGIAVGAHFEEPVVIVKCAWGGKSLYKDFRPPSADLPPEAELKKMHERATANAEKRKREPPTFDAIKAEFGKYYRATIADVRGVMNDVGSHFPELAGKKPELVGVVWFQGWNDMINAAYTDAYAENMAHFIRDIRRDLGVPQLPFVIGQLGVGGAADKAKKKDDKKARFKAAQAAAAELAEFKGNVTVVKTDQYWDWTAQAVFDKGWRENLEEWQTVGSDWPYHYLGSTITMSDIGKAFGKAMIELQAHGK